MRFDSRYDSTKSWKNQTTAWFKLKEPRERSHPLFHPNFRGVPLRPDCRCCGSRSEDPKLIIRVIIFELITNTYAHGTSTSRTDGRTERQTDGRTTYDSNTALALRASHGINQIMINHSHTIYYAAVSKYSNVLLNDLTKRQLQLCSITTTLYYIQVFHFRTEPNRSWRNCFAHPYHEVHNTVSLYRINTAAVQPNATLQLSPCSSLRLTFVKVTRRRLWGCELDGTQTSEWATTEKFVTFSRKFSSTIHCFTLIFTGRQRSCKPCTSYDRDVCLSVCPSVRPSVRLSHAEIVWKRRKLGSRNLHRWIAQGL